ncbi:MAG: N-acetylmuramic acid 6-phosphate etherase [Verrucomicrobiaceae bacterium]|nr:N-acetylmuramic acid 6-phosphate etherase [Verrucomicrobiaceae bacterium]
MSKKIAEVTAEPIPVYLGIEGGGTRSTAALSDADGRVLAEFQGGPANLILLSDRQLIWMLRGFASRLPLEGRVLTAVAVGLAGARTETHRDRIRRAAARVWPGVPCVATNDLETALAAADEDKDAVAKVLILSGTGSCCFARNHQGQTAKTGGRGHIIGDRGSACDIAQRGLKALMAHYDQTAKWPRLGVKFLEALALNNPEDLIPWSMEANKTDLASLATAVFAAARERDPIAAQVLTEAAQALADDGHACASRIAQSTDRVQFVFNGGVLLKNESFAKAVEMRLRTRWPRSVFTPVKVASSWGAVALARSQEGLLTENPTTEPPVLAGLPHDHPAFDLKLLRLSPTEQRNAKSSKLGEMSVAHAVALMLDDTTSVPRALRAEAAAIEWTIKKIATAFLADRHLFYVGAGTSGRLGVLDASECPPTFRAPQEQVQGIIAGGQRALWSAVEGAEDDPAAGAAAVDHRGVEAGDVVIGIAASGRTPYVWGALARAAELGATTVLVCFNPAFRKVEVPKGLFWPHKLIAPGLGPEVLTGSTRLKAGTATKLLLNLFTTVAMTRTGKVVSNLMVDLNPTNVKLRERAQWIVQELTGCDAEAARSALISTGWVVKDAWEKLKKKRKS